MQTIIKKFDELTLAQLYEIMKIRVDVFVVEQNCAYPELDDVDQKSIHVFMCEDDKIKAYLRVIPAGVTYNEVSLGRVISLKRRCGLGTQLLNIGIDVAKKEFNAEKIEIGAQVYARKMYENVGFKQSSEEYVEDGIPHIHMILEC